MRNSWKVAKWEIKRNMMNKSFLISLLLTPAIFAFFLFIPQLFGGNDSEKVIDVFVLDELGLSEQVEQIVKEERLNWNVQGTDLTESAMLEQVGQMENTVYMPLTEEALNEGTVRVYMSDDVPESFLFEAYSMERPLIMLQMDRLELSEEQMSAVAKGISIQRGEGKESDSGLTEAGSDPLSRLVPGIFAGIILFSIVMTGMMIFTSASQEKKEKVSEIILSSVTPVELMQGKIFGYFVLGITQVAVWIALALPIVVWKIDLPIVEYLLTPGLLLLLFFAVAGYLLFAAIFVAIGATVEDMTATSNFQAFVMMLPFLPLVFIAPILSDPSGLLAKIGSFIPFTSPAVWIMRLSLVDDWPWIEIGISSVILLGSIYVMMKAAGKVFQVGILLYGKNATPKEIWKWLWV